MGTWLGISCFAEFVSGFLALSLRADYIKNKETYNLQGIKIWIPDLNLVIFLSFLIGGILVITLCCWLGGRKSVKKCAGVTALIYGILQTCSILIGPLPVLCFIPILMISLIVYDLVCRKPRRRARPPAIQAHNAFQGEENR